MYRVERYKKGRNWAVYDPIGELICVTLYKRGALEIVRRLSAAAPDVERVKD